jgi:hypothetical protein
LIDNMIAMDKMNYPPAFCPVRGLFPARAIAIGGGAKNISFHNVATNCPVCNRTSEIIPGVYDSTPVGLNVLIDPSISPEALDAIKRLAQQLQKGEISPEQAKREAEKISPKLAKLFDISDWSDQAKATIYAAIIGAVAVVIAAKIASTSRQTVNVNPVVIERVIESPKKDLLSSTILRPSQGPPLPRSRPTKRR